MRQRNLFDQAQQETVPLPETVKMEVIDVLAQLMLSTLDAKVAMEEGDSDEPHQP